MKIFYFVIFCACAPGLFSCNKSNTLFEQVSSSHSGIRFNNEIVETDSLNPLNVVNVYNGGGAGIGDFNNDGLQDIFFTGNRVSSKLYLNKGDFKFEDVTDKAGVDGMGRWARGVAVVDINNDGLPDIYVCNTIYQDAAKRTNILYVNQGISKDGIPHFKDMAATYQLNIAAFSTMANFFDYDNDGDLDMYLTVNGATSDNHNKFGNTSGNEKMHESNTGKLFRNDWDSLAGHPVFHDVSVAAGIIYSGFGHGATIADINRDGWKDIYVSNDFISNNLLYINNHNGSFTDHSKEYFKHTSYNAMGQDIVDVNNDGLSDVIELDMSPKDNYRKKMMLAPNNYNAVHNFDIYGNQYQYVRNTLQLNQGPALYENDSVGSPVFSEVGFMSGIAQTDWSWTPLLADFDNNGFRDMIVTNGFPKDVTDHDFIAYRKNSVAGESQMQLVNKIPQVKLANFAFKNNDGVLFEDATVNWGLTTPSFSNGAAYADLDNDGDMDMVISNIDNEAFVYRNLLRQKADSNTHYLQVKCIGDKNNINGIGTWIDIYYNGNKHQACENTPYRGYLSTDENIAHFGLNNTSLVDSVVIKWPNGLKQTITNIHADQVLKVNIANAKEFYNWNNNELKTIPVFKEVTNAKNFKHLNYDEDFNDFNIQTNLPHKFSEYTPAMASADIDGNGFDDLVVAGNSFTLPAEYLQQANGSFLKKDLLGIKENFQRSNKDEGMLLFDANGDGVPDLYIASGGYSYAHNSASYQDNLYINDGKGNFKVDSFALPENHTSKLCVRAVDYNNDGRMDLFVSGRVDPANYPKPVSSFIYRNDSKDGKAKFTDVTAQVAPGLQNIGMVCDALFTDFDNDGQVDLILAGEWMPITFFKNNNGKFINTTAASGIDDNIGWWNSIVAGDFRHTGRTDYIIGNVGQNSFFKASKAFPVHITAKDFNGNGSFQAIPSVFLPAQDGSLKEFPAHGRDDIIDRIPSLKKRYDNYHEFAVATLNEILNGEQRKGALRLEANNFNSCFVRNDGNGKFTLIPLPEMAQVSTLNGMLADDFDNDGHLDVLINGNDYGTDVSVGRYDALNGLLLKGDGKGNFKPLSILQSGIYIPGNGKALVKMLDNKGNYMVAASQNKGPVKLFLLRNKPHVIKLQPSDMVAVAENADGSHDKTECYYGQSFLSQSSRFLLSGSQVKTITITNTRGEKRVIKPQ